MSLLTNAILTTLVIFLLLLPSFLFIRILKGISRGDIDARNLYTYLVWGIPLSLIFYTIYLKLGVYKIAGGRKQFPTEVLWKHIFPKDTVFADNAAFDNNLDSILIIKNIDSIFRTTVNNFNNISRNDTLFIIHEYQQDTVGNYTQLKQTQIIPHSDRSPTKNKAQTLRKVFTKERISIDTVPIHQTSKQRAVLSSEPLFNLKGYLVIHFFILLTLCGLSAAVIKKVIYFFYLDRYRFLMLESQLFNILSGRYNQLHKLREELLKKNKESKEEISKIRKKRKSKQEVIVSLLCEIGDQTKLYNGIVERFKVKDDILEYIVLKKVTCTDWMPLDNTGNVNGFSLSISMATNSKKNIPDFSLPNEIELNLSNTPTQTSIGIGKMQPDTNIKPDSIMYFYATQIKNMVVRYEPMPPRKQ